MVMSRHKKRRKSKSAAFYVPVAVLLSVFFVMLGTSVFLKILDIEVTGVSMYTEEEIILASGITPGVNMLLVDSGAISRKIYSAMPYIETVNIQFNLPDKMKINVSETTAFAKIDFIDDVVVIDSSCRVLERTDSITQGLIEIRGIAPVDVKTGNALSVEPRDETRLRRLKEILPAIDNAGIRQYVEYLDVTDMGNINIGYMDQFTVVLSSSGGDLSKLERLPEAVAEVKRDSKYDEAVRYKTNISDQSGVWEWIPER